MSFDLFTKLPVKVRDTIYTVLAAAFTVETTLDLAGVGVVPDKPQTIAMAVLGALGFSIAKSNVEKA